MGEVIQTLWDSGALGAIFTGFVTILGQLSALNTQKYTAVLEALQKQQAADITAHDAAFTRTKDDGGTWTRRADRKSTRLNSSHNRESRMPSSA